MWCPHQCCVVRGQSASITAKLQRQTLAHCRTQASHHYNSRTLFKRTGRKTGKAIQGAHSHAFIQGQLCLRALSVEPPQGDQQWGALQGKLGGPGCLLALRVPRPRQTDLPHLSLGNPSTHSMKLLSAAYMPGMKLDALHI